VDEKIALDPPRAMRSRHTGAGQYRICRLHKRGWNTMDALKALARESCIPLDQIGYAGGKTATRPPRSTCLCRRNLDLVHSIPGVSDR
jgi:hypothetical protein